MPKTKWTVDDVGCYADGAFGHQHVREILADLVKDCAPDVSKALLGEMSDDAWEEDAAVDLLNEHTAEGVCWSFDNGDLVLSHLFDE